MAKQVMNGLDLQAQKIISLADPSAAQDAATKQYVDNVARGLDWKNSVRAATTAAGTLASSFENGDTIDGVALVTGDRILIKTQAAGAENGIYTVNASGAPTRATDADSSAEVTSGMAVSVTEGTVNGDKTYVLTTNDPIVLGTDALAFSPLGGGTPYTAGDGLTLTGQDFNVGAGTGITVDATNVNIDPSVVTRKFAANVGNGSSTSIVVNHALGSRDAVVTVYRATTPWDEVIVDIERTDANNVTLNFAVAPTSNQFRAVVHV